MRVNISISDDLLEVLDAHCLSSGATRSGYIQKCVRDGLQGTGPLSETPPPKLEVAQQAFDQKMKVLTSPSTEGNCDSCKRFSNLLSDVTYLDDDQVRVTGRLCPPCKSKCKASGSYIDG